MNIQAKIAELQARVLMEKVRVDGLIAENIIHEWEHSRYIHDRPEFQNAVGAIEYYADELKKIAERE